MSERMHAAADNGGEGWTLDPRTPVEVERRLREGEITLDQSLYEWGLMGVEVF